ncbi:MAG: hypothetical protein H0U79_08410 [Solirubrobacterales bacterium]|nr:hypothetical protein [Solirubrobacterales bacterium]
MDPDNLTVVLFTVTSVVIALAMVALALGPLRERGPGRRHEGEGGIPAPFAPDEDDDSPLGATDQTSDERSARETRSVIAQD